MIKKALVTSVSAILSGALATTCAHAFIVKQIQYIGLQHVPLSTVQSEMPISVGDNLTSARSNAIIKDLNGTGFLIIFSFINQATPCSLRCMNVQPLLIFILPVIA